jgi:hypothetical protein
MGSGWTDPLLLAHDGVPRQREGRRGVVIPAPPKKYPIDQKGFFYMAPKDKPMQDEATVRACEAWTVTLYIGGPVEEAKRALSVIAAKVGVCWSVEPTEFIYSGGREQGVIVRQIAYARFPSSADDAMTDMLMVGEGLMEHLGQGSFTVIGPDKSMFVSRRKGDSV